MTSEHGRTTGLSPENVKQVRIQSEDDERMDQAASATGPQEPP